MAPRIPLTPAEERLLSVMRTDANATPRQIADAMGWNGESAVYEVQRRLATRGYLDRTEYRGTDRRRGVRYTVKAE